ncbi:MAG: hypothetical protein JWO38_5959 [Gemmataceae bacterium]|nr:hypothetical protein [Gemmataceae bacterium]
MTNVVRGLFLAAGVAVAVALGGSQVRADKDKKPDAKGQVVKKVTGVDVKGLDSDPPFLDVTATGEVPTGGWTGTKLTRRTYVKPPADGVYEYDLTAVPPAGIAAQVISKVTATDRWKDPPKDIKGVKVYGAGDGVKTVKFEEKK